MRLRRTIPLCLALVLLAACAPAIAPATEQLPATETPRPSSTPLFVGIVSATPIALDSPEPTSAVALPVRFAVIGDYGYAGGAENGVAELVKAWDPHFIVTTGDNNYPDGAAETIDENIGQYYHAYIGNYQGEYGAGSEENRFFPSLGNHDWDTPGAQPYFDYFTLPGNERYYDVRWGLVHFFILDTDTREPDGIGLSSVQAAWLEATMALSDATWKIVVMHHPAFSSALHGDHVAVQWPFREWGADLVLAGHDHVYERLEVNQLTYITNGLGGHSASYYFVDIRPDSIVRHREPRGALFIVLDEASLYLEFVTVEGQTVDSLTLYPDAD